MVLFTAGLLAAAGLVAEPDGSLDWMEGTWRGTRSDGTGASGASVELTVRAILGGAGFAEDLVVDDADSVYRGHAITVYDTEAGLWVRHYVNADRGRFVRLEGHIEGTRSTWRNTDPDRTRESLLVSELLEGDRWRRTHRISEDGGASWRVLWQDELERVDAPRRPAPIARTVEPGNRPKIGLALSGGGPRASRTSTF